MEKVAPELDQRYDEIITTAKTEYEYEPPGEYFKDGYTFNKRIGRRKEGTHSFYMIQGGNRIQPGRKMCKKFKRKAAQGDVRFRSQKWSRLVLRRL